MEKNNNIIVPLAIIIAGAFIAGAIYFSGSTKDDANKNISNNTGSNNKEIDLEPVSLEDHILGSPEASIMIVEYSDTECPYCKNFHGTMNKIMDEYAKDGKVAWVYRHFPIDSLHSRARKEAEATECAEEIGGNKAFWSYINKIFEITPSNNGLDPKELPNIAKEIGIDVNAFEECLSSGRMSDKVERQFKSGVKAGVRGTPFSIIITSKDGKMYPLNGAQSYNTVKSIIDAGLEDSKN